MRYSTLDDLCYCPKEKVAVSSLDLYNYISTENMLPDKQGITFANSLPKANTTQGYKKGDILISNIRPYFKKIWKASNSGGCSNDVIVFRAKENINSDFLYYVLANDNFFNYAMSTAKGTKMPRGDRQMIMKYLVPVFDMKNQLRLANTLCSLDNKIKNNQKINNNLVA